MDKSKKYQVAKNPHDGLYYAIGFCGSNPKGTRQFMPISQGYSSKAEAEAFALSQHKVDKAMARELGGTLESPQQGA